MSLFKSSFLKTINYSPSILVPNVSFRKLSCFTPKVPGKNLELAVSSSTMIPKTLKVLATSSEQKKPLFSSIILSLPSAVWPGFNFTVLFLKSSFSAPRLYLLPWTYLINSSSFNIVSSDLLKLTFL